MLPTNVMSFMKKMVTTQPESETVDALTPEDTGTTFSKLRQLMTSTGNVARASSTKITLVESIVPREEPVVGITQPESGKPVSRGDACRVCRKSFRPEDFSRTCYECQFKVCEDCASYSETKDIDDPSIWRCSVCRRRIASRGQPMIAQESTDSMLEIPLMEALTRRHSEARLNCQGGGQSVGLVSALAPPRSPEVRRHSDVSTASLKELEKFRKVAGERREEIRWGKELEWRNKSRAGSPDRLLCDRGRASSPQRLSKDQLNDQEIGDIGEDEDERRRRAVRRIAAGGTIRRKSRVTKQHSYDEEIKAVMSVGVGGGGGLSPSGRDSGNLDNGLGFPVQLPRRASAYDVYAAPGSVSLNAIAIAAAQQRASISAQGSRESDERSPVRRQSFRSPKPIMPYEIADDDEKIIILDKAMQELPAVQSDESRPASRRRASMLPEICTIRALPSVPIPIKAVSPAVTRVAVQDDRGLPRQGSLADGEGIKIVIHDVDSDHGLRVNTKRRIVLKKEPRLMDKGHRTRGFGMRVVGGKAGMDGRLYASVVWTVSGGPAEMVGLHKGDKILEWSGVSLIDRNFEDVAQIIEHTGDVAELVVESVDIGDQHDEPGISQPSGKISGSLGLQLDSETDKTPSSPTRRKLPKTPEQIAKVRQVTGRVQIQVWYEADKKELVVSVFAADEICLRDPDTGALPEAFAKLVLALPSEEQNPVQTEVAGPTQNPIWNANLTFSDIAGGELMDGTIDVTLWDFPPDGEDTFLGECEVVLQNAFEADRAVWYRLEDPKGLRSGKSLHASLRGSLSTEIAQRYSRREIRERNYSENTPTDSGSPEPYSLHPDHAWQEKSRRGSSQSEQLEVESYELNKDYSRSLPGSRRSSFQSQGGTDSKRVSIVDSDMPIVHHNPERRRNSVARTMRDPKEVSKSLDKAAAEGELSQTMNISNDKKRSSRM